MVKKIGSSKLICQAYINKTLADAVVTLSNLDPFLIKNVDEIQALQEVDNIMEAENIVSDYRFNAIEQIITLIDNYDTILANLETQILADYPNIHKAGLTMLKLNFAKPEALARLDIAHPTTYTTTRMLEILLYYKSGIAKLTVSKPTLLDDVDKNSVLVEEILTTIETTIVQPLKDFHVAQEAMYQFVHPMVDNFDAPKSFDFGDYSFTKHTGRSYMLTQRVGNKFITQEVATDTLLPLRPSQKPLLEDEALRKRFLFVIAKKTEVAKTTKTEPTLPEPEKKAKSVKPAEKKTVFEWGDWTVKEFDDTHYVVSKNVDKTGYEQSDDDQSDENYSSIQVVSKKTLLPDAMLGATGKPLLSSSERTKLLDWIEHETHPLIYKLRTDDPTKKDRIIYVANLTNPEEVFANLKKDSQAATPSSLSITDPSFEKLALYLATKATPSLQKIVLK